MAAGVYCDLPVSLNRVMLWRARKAYGASAHPNRNSALHWLQIRPETIQLYRCRNLYGIIRNGGGGMAFVTI